ncbi:nitronate monooxygenase [Porticoccaceae bacterium]|jgi:nitronate monooxygenase|nr:nitronate monooxygenase [bacterium]MDA8734472.1 nitronate monooxygenase [Porticoccaceae bacterium]MDA8786981.1 nitronate monooxygenase [Porticoccaceae bacterium]|tara:strand:+ start:9243 stop:10208 length:966 start_codon:yes stop_codon:yes gene_type:complete
MKTRFTELFGIEHPIVCGGMMRVGTAELAAAVSNAGALGIMTALSQPTPELLEAEIQKCHSLTGKPFAVNLTVGVVATQINYDDYVDVICRNGVKIVETAGRSPEPFMERFSAQGIKVIHKAVTVRHALKAEKLGVAAISIDGFECAGHPGDDDIGGLVLIPAAASKLSIPIIASGGIADGRGLAGALALGADAINMGTRFVATREAPVHEDIKKAIVDMTETDTALIFRTFGNTARVYKNKVATQVLEIERAGGDFSQIHPLVSGKQQEIAWSTGAKDAGMITFGMSGGLIHDVPTCQDLVNTIMVDAEEIVKNRLTSML